MDMLNKQEVKQLAPESLTENFPSNDLYRQPVFTNGSYQSLNEHTVSLETENTSTRHSSGCDDSGVFLEDLPYAPDSFTILGQTDPCIDKLSDLKSSDMRPYSIDSVQAGMDSDAERSDDLGLASSSVDSADDLDGDPLPSTIKISQSQSPKKPPPVPPRKPMTNGSFESQKDINTIIKKIETTAVQTPQSYSVHKIEKSCSLQPRNDTESQKWKSEECLRSAVESKWFQRANEKGISVKDRIAMFSEMEATSSPKNKKESPLHRFASETNVKAVESMHKKEDHESTTSPKADFPAIDRDPKWYSMYSLPLSSSISNPEEKSETDNLKPANSIPSLINVSNDAGRESDPASNSVPLKVETDNLRYAEKPIVSNYPQTQLTNNRRYSYGSYNLSGIRTTEDLLNKKNSASGLLSIIDSRKQPLGKLKGLVIPEKPTPTTIKALPTIVSNDSVIANNKSDADVSKILHRSMLSAASYKTMSLPRTRDELKSKSESSFVRDSPKLAEPPWKTTVSNGNTFLKYSPAFTTRTLDLPNAVTSSLSPTPPSSITSPLSPPPSSPSSICSSNASSATSVATMQQNIFQFSLSHSKPVTPVLPEKPIMSPPSLPSDIEYEGDNSEDSSTSASPMISKMSAKLSSCSRRDSAAASNSEQRYSQVGDYPNSPYHDSRGTSGATRTYTSYSSNNSNRNNSAPNSVQESSTLHAKTNGNAMDKSTLDDSDFFLKQPYSSTTRKQYKQDNFNKDGVSKHYSRDPNPNHSNTRQTDANIFDDDHTDGTNTLNGNRNGFLATSQEVQMTKFRAQPLVLSQSIKDSSSESCSSLPRTSNTYMNDVPCNSSEKSNFSDSNGRIAAPTSFIEEQKTYISSCEFVPSQQWLQNTELINYRKNKLDSEDDDDTHSSLSHRTEDSRPTTDDYLSDATTDSFDKSLDPDLKPRRLSQQKVVLKAAVDSTDSVQKFKALAEKWEHRGDAKSPPPPPPPLIPAPRKDSKPYSGSIPTTSSFLSSIITSSTTSCSRTNSSAPTNNSVKLPPSLLPRNKQTEKTEKNGSSKHSQKPNSTLNRDSKKSYESIWCDERSRKSSLNSSRDFSDSGSSTDTGSNYSRKTSSKESWLACERLQSSKCLGNDAFELSETNSLDGILSSKSDNDVFASEDELPNSRSKKTFNVSTSRESSRESKFETNRGVTRNNAEYETHSSQYTRKSESLGKTTNNSSSSRRRSSFDKESFDCPWASHRDQKSDFPTTRTLSKSQASLRDPLESVRSPATSYFSSKNAKSVSVSDIRKAFETQCSQNSQALATKPPPLPPRQAVASEGPTVKQNGIHGQQSSILPDHKRFSSLDSTTSGDSDLLTTSRYGSAGSLTSLSRDTFGSMTSLASTASLMSPQEIQQLVEEANQSLEASSGGKHVNQKIHVIVLQREVPAGSIGITLAGGSDYEVKEITVHKVISGSLADRDGRIKKGDRVLSINGRNLKGITHREALEILKAPRPEVVLVIAREPADDNGLDTGRREKELQRSSASERARAREEFRKKSESFAAKDCADPQVGSNVVCVQLQKDTTGLGFSIEGGKDSPLGDRPLLIKRIFKGGVADKDGNLDVGDELISVNGQLVTAMTRTEAWNFLKKLPEETVLVRARKQVSCLS